MKTIDTNICGVIAFPNVTACLGGAEYVRWTARVARIKLPGIAQPVRMLRSQLPSVDKWTAFNLADAAQATLTR